MNNSVAPEAVLGRKTVERFSNELKLARKIRHKNIRRMFDLGEDQGTRYITMEYIHGEVLQQLIRKAGRGRWTLIHPRYHYQPRVGELTSPLGFRYISGMIEGGGI